MARVQEHELTVAAPSGWDREGEPRRRAIGGHDRPGFGVRIRHDRVARSDQDVGARASGFEREIVRQLQGERCRPLHTRTSSRNQLIFWFAAHEAGLDESRHTLRESPDERRMKRIALLFAGIAACQSSSCTRRACRSDSWVSLR